MVENLGNRGLQKAQANDVVEKYLIEACSISYNNIRPTVKSDYSVIEKLKSRATTISIMCSLIPFYYS